MEVVLSTSEKVVTPPFWSILRKHIHLERAPAQVLAYLVAGAVPIGLLTYFNSKATADENAVTIAVPVAAMLIASRLVSLRAVLKWLVRFNPAPIIFIVSFLSVIGYRWLGLGVAASVAQWILIGTVGYFGALWLPVFVFRLVPEAVRRLANSLRSSELEPPNEADVSLSASEKEELLRRLEEKKTVEAEIDRLRAAGKPTNRADRFISQFSLEFALSAPSEPETDWEKPAKTRRTA